MSEEGFNGKNSKFLIEVTGTNTVACGVCWMVAFSTRRRGIKSREKRDGTVDVALPIVLRAHGGPDKI